MECGTEEGLVDGEGSGEIGGDGDDDEVGGDESDDEDSEAGEFEDVRGVVEEVQ